MIRRKVAIRGGRGLCYRGIMPRIYSLLHPRLERHWREGRGGPRGGRCGEVQSRPLSALREYMPYQRGRERRQAPRRGGAGRGARCDQAKQALTCVWTCSTWCSLDTQAAPRRLPPALCTPEMMRLDAQCTTLSASRPATERVQPCAAVIGGEIQGTRVVMSGLRPHLSTGTAGLKSVMPTSAALSVTT